MDEQELTDFEALEKLLLETESTDEKSDEIEEVEEKAAEDEVVEEEVPELEEKEDSPDPDNTEDTSEVEEKEEAEEVVEEKADEEDGVEEKGGMNNHPPVVDDEDEDLLDAGDVVGEITDEEDEDEKSVEEKADSDEDEDDADLPVETETPDDEEEESVETPATDEGEEDDETVEDYDVNVDGTRKEDEERIEAIEDGDEDEEEKSVTNLTREEHTDLISKGAIINSETYEGLDDDAKEAFAQKRFHVEAFEDIDGGSYDAWERKSLIEEIADDEVVEEKAVEEEVEEKAAKTNYNKLEFATEEEAVAAAEEIGCEGTHTHGEIYMPCGSHEDLTAKLEAQTEKSEEDDTETKDSVEIEESETKDLDEDVETKAEFLCGLQRKTVEAPCGVCSGGCAPEEGMPSLAEVEAKVLSDHGGEVIHSGYSALENMFIVDIKTDDGFFEAFRDGDDGSDLGYLRAQEQSASPRIPTKVISPEEAGVKALGVITDGTLMGEPYPGDFSGETVYVVETDAESKSYDVFVALDGQVLGYDEYNVDEKRLYTREDREAMAESGEAMKDGSYPIGDQADAVEAVKVAIEEEAPLEVREHIVKRTKELKLTDIIPDGFLPEPEPEEEVEVPAEEKALLDDLAEFKALLNPDN